MNERVRIFFDLDFTLYDTALLMTDLRSDLERLGYSDRAITEGFECLNDVGYSFEGHLRLLGHPEADIQEVADDLGRRLRRGKKYLLPGAFDCLADLQAVAELHLLTFGYPFYQRAKFAGLAETVGLFADSHFIWKGESKGDVIARFGAERETWFVDDSPAHLEDACRKAPWVKAVRMLWPGFNVRLAPGDHIRWEMVRSFDELFALVRKS